MSRREERKFRTHQFFALIWIITIFAIFLLIENYSPFAQITTLLNLLLSINIATFLLFALDKLQAITNRRRIPELILHASALLGGPLGALIAMKLVRHKTRKHSFQLVLVLILFLQLTLAYFFFVQEL